MSKNFNDSTWMHILEKFSSYQGSKSSFCKENNISKSQLYYYRKKLEKSNNSIFHAVTLDGNVTNKPVANNSNKANEIRIEIGSANIYIPMNEIAVLATILKELAKSC
ncbi:hypothetical protein [Clostridium sp. C8-1-8]|uniref:IS66 family insertion sequence element accessory protein TnpA n=1 Tax=Clostridium sp. C8-1-8 TaxID=2698831 RepID=UPI00136F766B|nr:hypothetical protein [Clostridium sp. C8-1-8]